MRPRTGIAAFVTAAERGGRARRRRRGAGAQRERRQGRVGDDTRLIPGDLLVSTSYYANDPDIVAGHDRAAARVHRARLRDRDRRTATTRTCSTTTRSTPASASPPGSSCSEITPWGRPQGVIPVPTQRAGHQLLLEVGGRAQPVPRRQVPDVHRLRGRAGHRSTSRTRTPPASSTRPTRSPARTTGRWRQLSANGKFTFTETNAYSGNNGRAAIEAKVNGKYYIYTAGNAGNGVQPAARRASSSAPARRSSPRRTCPRRTRRQASRPRSAASTSPSSATRRTRSARTTTSAA